jgi:hypothetical protein
MTLSNDDLGSKILLCSNKTVRDKIGFDNHLWSRTTGSNTHGILNNAGIDRLTACLGQIEISQAHMSIRMQENIFWLEIAVDEAQGVEILEGEQNFSRVETHLILSKTTVRLALDRAVKFSTGAEIHDKVQARLRLETVVQRCDERMACSGEDLTLCQDTFYLNWKKTISANLHTMDRDRGPRKVISKRDMIIGIGGAEKLF